MVLKVIFDSRQMNKYFCLHCERLKCVCVFICLPHLKGPLHGDSEVVLPARVAPLADEHLVADASSLPSLFGVQLSTNHLRGDVPGFFRPGN